MSRSTRLLLAWVLAAVAPALAAQSAEEVHEWLKGVDASRSAFGEASDGASIVTPCFVSRSASKRAVTSSDHDAAAPPSDTTKPS